MIKGFHANDKLDRLSWWRKNKYYSHGDSSIDVPTALLFRIGELQVYGVIYGKNI